MRRVAALLDTWSSSLKLPDEEQLRWRALGFLHDTLKDRDAATLRGMVPPEFADLPDPVLHGPAVAARLRDEGVDDEPFLRALTYHTLGHPQLDRAGRALYAADFLEPGRKLEQSWRRKLRRRMPRALDEVVAEIVRARITFLLKRDRPVRAETLAFWNRFTEGDAWARASEV
jgi:2-amino-4-hydroxy-6-hydroxymethyldihydropteridine diphosphokinase